MTTTIRFDPTTNQQTCTTHGAASVARSGVDAYCWQCDGRRPGCEHAGATATVIGIGTRTFGQHRWTMHPCPDCQAERDAVRRERDQAAALAQAEREQAARFARQEREAEIAKQLHPGEVALIARYAGRCLDCDAPIAVGTRIAHNREQHTTRHLLGCRPERNTFNCRYCGEPVIGGQSSFGGYLCPMSDGGEQPHRA